MSLSCLLCRAVSNLILVLFVIMKQIDVIREKYGSYRIKDLNGKVVYPTVSGTQLWSGWPPTNISVTNVHRCDPLYPNLIVTFPAFDTRKRNISPCSTFQLFSSHAPQGRLLVIWLIVHGSVHFICQKTYYHVSVVLKNRSGNLVFWYPLIGHHDVLVQCISITTSSDGCDWLKIIR